MYSRIVDDFEKENILDMVKVYTKQMIRIVTMLFNKSGGGSAVDENHAAIAYTMSNTEASFLILRLQNDVSLMNDIVNQLLYGPLEHSKSTINEDIFDTKQLNTIVDKANKQLGNIGKKVAVSIYNFQCFFSH